MHYITLLLALLSLVSSVTALVGGPAHSAVLVGGALSPHSWSKSRVGWPPRYAAAVSRASPTMQQHSGGARQRHRMRDKEMERIERQREPTGGFMPKREARRAASAQKLMSSKQAARPRTRGQLAQSTQKTTRPGGVAPRQGPAKWRRTGDSELPVHVVAVEALLEEREEARARRDYAQADGLREELWGLGVSIFDNERTWTVVKRVS